MAIHFLFGPARLDGIIGIKPYEQKGNNVSIIDGGRELTLLSTCIYLDEPEEADLTALGQRLRSADDAIIGSHDYREVVTVNMAAAIEYLTIDHIGELVRQGEIRNDWQGIRYAERRA